MSTHSRDAVVLVVVVALLGAAVPVATGTQPDSRECPPTLGSWLPDRTLPVEASGQLAPGVTAESGVTDPWALASAHARNLRRTTWTLVSSHSSRWADGAVFFNTTERFEHETFVRYHRVTDGCTERSPAVAVSGSFHRERFADGQRVHRLVRRSGTNRTDVVTIGGRNASPGQVHPFPSALRAHLYRAFRNYDPSLRGTVYGNGTALYVFEGTRRNVTEQVYFGLPGNATYETVTFTADVSPRGVVRAYEFAFEATYRGRTVTGHHRVRFVRVGSTVVTRPDWVGTTAENATVG